MVAHLRTRGNMVFPYLDNWLLLLSLELVHWEYIQVTLALLQTLGFKVNITNANLQPSHRLQFIGANINTSFCRAFLPPDRIDSMKHCLQAPPSGGGKGKGHSKTARTDGGDYGSPCIHRIENETLAALFHSDLQLT